MAQEISRFQTEAPEVQAPVQLDPQALLLQQLRQRAMLSAMQPQETSSVTTTQKVPLTEQDWQAVGQDAGRVNAMNPLMAANQAQNARDEAELRRNFANRPTPIDWTPAARYFDTHFGNESHPEAAGGYKYGGTTYQQDLQAKQQLLQQLAQRRNSDAENQQQVLLKMLQDRIGNQGTITKVEKTMSDPTKAAKILMGGGSGGVDKELNKDLRFYKKEVDDISTLDGVLNSAKELNEKVGEARMVGGKLLDYTGFGSAVRDEEALQLSKLFGIIQQRGSNIIEKYKVGAKDQGRYLKILAGDLGATREDRRESINLLTKILRSSARTLNSSASRVYEHHMKNKVLRPWDKLGTPRGAEDGEDPFEIESAAPKKDKLKVGDVVDGLKYKGGDPGMQTSWGE